VLSDAGAGFGSADAIEWCIFNKDRVWDGLSPGDPYVGIDVLNLSLGCIGCNSDGTDAGAQSVNAGVNAGLIICIASGNDDGQGVITSPAAADHAITVGATTHLGSIRREDDLVTDFSNEGPRLSDGDGDQLDEYKPNVVTPGAGIMSANGDWTSDGGSYNKLSGTSMACPHMAGVAALVKQANPSLAPLEIRSILQNTALHHISSQKGDRPADPFGIDPNYDPMSGWGLVDVYAAALEAINSTSGVQVTRIKADARPLDGEIDVRWWTQREFVLLGFNVHRAPDVGESPGAFTQINALLVTPAGDPIIQGDDNRTPYLLVDDDPTLALGQTYWYQVEWVDLSGGHLEPPVPVNYGENPRVATVFYSVKHNTPDNDLTARVGTSSSYTPQIAEYSVLGPGTAAADSSVTIEPANTGTAAVGYLRWYWSLGFTAGDGIDPYLPPNMLHPWFLNVTDDCFINRTGTIESFSMFVNDSPGSAGGNTYFTDTPLPLPTGENCLVPGPDVSSTAWIPEAQPVQTLVLRLDAESDESGVHIRLELASGSSEATAVVYRNTTSEFAGRYAVTGEMPLENGVLDFTDSALEPGVSYWYWVDLYRSGAEPVISGPVQVTAPGVSLARTVALAPRPNPALSGATFQFVIGSDLAANGAVPVALTLHDERGRLIRTLVRDERGVGEYSQRWDLRSDSGTSVTPRAWMVDV